MDSSRPKSSRNYESNFLDFLAQTRVAPDGQQMRQRRPYHETASSSRAILVEARLRAGAAAGGGQGLQWQEKQQQWYEKRMWRWLELNLSNRQEQERRRWTSPFQS